MKKLNNRGETLLESILSIVLFTLMMALVTTIMFTAFRITQKNTETSKEFTAVIEQVDAGATVGTQLSNVTLELAITLKVGVGSTPLTKNYTNFKLYSAGYNLYTVTATAS